MGQSLVKNYLHIIFSVKNWQPLIHPPIEKELHKYLGGICNQLECMPLIVGGHNNHIHILCNLSKKVTLSDLIGKLKAKSSKWIKSKGRAYKIFYWQNGYGAFSVNPSQISNLVSYIENQKEHHKEITFQDEYKAFLEKYNVEYDERYVWD